jgi:hypothetical protein
VEAKVVDVAFLAELHSQPDLGPTVVLQANQQRDDIVLL